MRTNYNEIGRAPALDRVPSRKRKRARFGEAKGRRMFSGEPGGPWERSGAFGGNPKV